MTTEILHGDCRQLLEGKLWDVMITDPPYSEHVHKSATSCGTPGARPSKNARGAYRRDLGFDHLSHELFLYTCQLAARTPKWSVIFTDTESVGMWRDGLTDAGASYIRAVPWVRWSMPQLSGCRPPQGHEMIVLGWGSARGRKSWNGPGNLTHLAHTCMRGDGKHKTQKPLDQMLDLVEYFSNPNDMICDPFSGSGTTALAAKLLGRNATGVELDSAWVERSIARLADESLGQLDDRERFDRYKKASALRQLEMIRMAENTAKIRANRDAKKVSA